MFRSPPCVLSPEPSRAELAAAITAADEISVDCTGYTFALLSSRRVARISVAQKPRSTLLAWARKAPPVNARAIDARCVAKQASRSLPLGFSSNFYNGAHEAFPRFPSLVFFFAALSVIMQRLGH